MSLRAKLIALAVVVVMAASVAIRRGTLIEWRYSRADLPTLVALSQQQPRNARVRLHLARSLLAIGDSARAIQVLQEARELQPHDAEVRWWQGRALTQAHRDAEAFQAWQEMAKEPRYAAQAHRELGLLHSRHDAFESAAQELREAARLSPNDAVSWRALGETLTELRRRSEAREAFARALKLEAKNARALVSLARHHLRFGELEQAAEAARRASTIDPKNVAAAVIQVELVSLQPGREEALRYAKTRIQQAIGDQPEAADAHLALGRLCAQLREWRQAIAALNESLRLRPNQEEALFRLGQAYLAAGEQAAGERMLREFQQAGDYQLQARHLQLRIAREPNSSQLRFRLARLYAAHGEVARAMFQYEAGLKLEPNDRRAIREIKQLRGTPRD